MAEPRPGYYLADGSHVPSVTTIIGRFKESGGLIHWAWALGKEGKDYREVRDKAADAGTMAHDAVEAWVHGKRSPCGSVRVHPLIFLLTQDTASMTTSRGRNLSNRQTSGQIRPGTLGYFRMRTRMRMFTLVRKEFEKANITKAELAKRLGKGAGQVNRWLATPRNWTLDTLSDLLYATTGTELSSNIAHPSTPKASES